LSVASLDFIYNIAPDYTEDILMKVEFSIETVDNWNCPNPPESKYD
jgi:hypothetical protein